MVASDSFGEFLREQLAPLGHVAMRRMFGKTGVFCDGVMFGMVTATGIRILGGVDFKGNRHNALIVAIAIGVGMVPLIAPNFKQWMPHGIHPLIDSGILLSSIAAVALNLFFNGAKGEAARDDVIAAAKVAEAH